MKPNTEITFTSSNLKLHTFSTSIADLLYIYEIIRLKDSLMIFVNLKDRRELNDLSLAVQNRFDNLPVGTRIFGDFMDDSSKQVAQRVSKRLRKAVFVSLNVLTDKHTLPLIERQLFLEIKDKPDMF